MLARLPVCCVPEESRCVVQIQSASGKIAGRAVRMHYCVSEANVQRAFDCLCLL